MKMFKFLKLPGPKELGMSERDALEWGPTATGPTWDDWEERVKKEYPVRYFLSEVVGDWFWGLWMRLKGWYYYLKSRFWVKYHIIDIRNTSDSDPTCHGTGPHYGYRDPRDRFYAAGWQLFEEWLSHVDLTSVYGASTYIDEVNALVKWRKEERPVLAKQVLEALHRDDLSSAKEYFALEKQLAAKDLEMFVRLAKIYQHMWL